MIYYKQLNPSSLNNISSGYALNDFWINIVTYTKYEQTSDGVWSWREYSGENIIYPRLNQQAGSVVVSNGFSGDGTPANPISPIPKLDFLFVDYWKMSDYTMVKDLIILDYNVLLYKKVREQIVNDLPVLDWITYSDETHDISKLSQTTIFIHPTTFQRYLFNGTTMVEYDDPDGVVPKWLKYEALLTQSDANKPIARVINADEKDYLGDVEWLYDSENLLLGTNNKLNGTINFYQAIAGDSSIIGMNISNGSLEFYRTNFGYCQISIKQRIRGNPPKLVSAETNVAGDKVILTFDKKMNVYGLDNAIADSTLDFNGISFLGVDSILDNIIILNIDAETKIEYNENIILSANTNSPIESFDLGLLQPFENFPVTNNVPAPPVLLDAYTNADGSRVTFVFDKEMYYDFSVGISDNDLSFTVNAGITIWSVDWTSIVEGNKIHLYFNGYFSEIVIMPGDVIKSNGYGSYMGIVYSKDGGALSDWNNYTVRNLVQ